MDPDLWTLWFRGFCIAVFIVGFVVSLIFTFLMWCLGVI